LDDAQQIIAIARDIVFLVLVLAVLLVVLALYRKVSGVLGSVKRTVEDTEHIISIVSSKIAGPAAAGSGVASGAGKVASFLFGFGRRRGRGRDRRERDGKESRDGGRNDGG
jgi:hypothetical protein